jgi:peptide deformylase
MSSPNLSARRMFEDLKIIHYPDPRLRKQSKVVEAFDDALRALASRMFELMRAQRGVGLAAPQVGQNVRMFVMNPTGKPEDDRVYVNPVLIEPDGEEEGEEGCLSLPNINANVLRSRTLTIKAYDLSGQAFEQTESGYVARIWQHENDHLNGVLILDHMSPVAKLGARRALRELRDKWDEEHGG